MKLKRHMSANIEGMLRNYKGRKMDGLMNDENGKEMSDKEIRKYLAECLAKGWRVIPCGDCEGFDYQTGCPGHVIEGD
ncbi:MAG TPA: hypothetical protein VD794_05730 [Flavisolibacter sp.]|nr:hypothetical protein [Flavisolibacter sp.]